MKQAIESLFFSFYNTDPEGKNPQLNLGFPWRLHSTIHHTKKKYIKYIYKYLVDLEEQLFL